MESFNGETKHGANFTAADLGELVNLNQFSFKLPTSSFEVEGKLFLNQILDLTSCEISFNKLPPKVAIPFYHKHHLNEEIYLFLKGNGEFQIDGKVLSVGEGTVIRVAPDGERTLRNKAEEDLYYIVFQARAHSYEGNAVMDGLKVEKRVSWVNKEPA